MTIYSNISEIDLSQWTNLVHGSSTASFFQTPECYDFYASLGFMNAFVYGVSENDKLVGLMCGYVISDGNAAKRFFSKRAIVPGGLLLDMEISALAIQKLLECAAADLQSRAIYIEIRNYKDYGVYRPAIQSAGFNYLPHLNIHVPTPDIATAMSGMHASRRRQLKAAQRLGVTWSETTDVTDIRAFYDCLLHIYTTKVKTSLFPIEFFEKLVGLKNGKLLVVKHNEEVIGGMACVILPDNTLYEWFVCGEETGEKGYYPSVMATWAGMECAILQNIPRFDFMGAGKPDEGYGVRDFKSKFGGEIVEHGRFLYICKPKLFKLGKWMVGRMKNQ